MKAITKMSRLTGQLEKAYNLINEELFNNELPTTIISVASTPRAYGHFTVSKVWSAKDERRHEINISSDYLNRPLEDTLTTLIHEMCHLYCSENNLKDTSNNGVYHNKTFRRVAEDHGLNVERSDRYGWSHTSPSERILNFIIQHDELNEIEICRHDSISPLIGIGGHSGSNTGVSPTGTKKTHHRKYICPCCGTNVRATKVVNIGCLDCGVTMIMA